MYQKNSVPQLRYITEDIPTGLVTYEALAKMLGIECSACTNIIDMYDKLTGGDVRLEGRNLEGFSKEYVVQYLKGENI